MRLRQSGALLLAAFTLSCGGTAAIRPVAAPDPEAACPGGRLAWTLQISDQRAERRESEKLIALVRASVSQSFPGCRWTPEPAAPLITIEIHRFASDPHENLWDAAAEWTVSAREASGAVLTEFQAESEVSRPNYRGSNNEVESLREVFGNAMKRTLAGLRSIPPAK